MSIHLYFSSQLETLAAQLARNVAAEQREKPNPFLSERVVVPNPNMKKWLKMWLAAQNGLTINIQFPFLEEGLWSVLHQKEDGVTGETRLLDRDTLQIMIMGWFFNQDADAGHWRPFREFICGSGRPARKRMWEKLDPDQARRLQQLSARLASLFVEYEYHRGDMVAGWRKNRLQASREKTSPLDAELEKAQQTLFLGIFGPGGIQEQLREVCGLRHLTLPQYADVVMGNDIPNSHKKPEGAQPMHLFCLSQLSVFHRDLLFRLAERIPIRMYHLNVCQEFWEDISTPREDRWIDWKRIREIPVIQTPEGEELLESEWENELLKAWGKPGREALRLFSDLEDRCAGRIGFQAEWLEGENCRDPRNRTVLKTLQHQILQRKSGPTGITQDRSLQIAACPGLYREVETVYNSILHNMAEKSDLKLTDIAVLVPDMELYKPVITSVFEKGGQIPYSLIDSNASLESLYGKAVMTLLGLAGGPFTRKEVFDLIFNPCFLARMGMDGGEAVEWLHLVDRLHIFRGFETVTGAGKEVESPEPFTWQHGLQRLRLGRIMEMPGEPDPEEDFPSFCGIVPYQDAESHDPVSIGRMCHAVEALYNRLSPLATAVFSFREWLEVIDGLLKEFLDIPPDRKAETVIRQKLLQALQDLQLLDRIAGTEQQKKRWPLHIVREHLRHALESIPGYRGGYLSGGVSIASLLPMRPIPFEVVYVLGLGEGRFPGTAETATLDLRSRFRKLGDVNRVEANCYLFMESLISTRKKLYLSYVSRNLQKMEELYPGSILKQLLRYLDNHLLSRSFAPVRIPLKGSSTAYLHPPAEYRETTDLFFNSSKSERLMALLDVAKSGQTLPDGQRAEIERLAALHTPAFTIAGQAESTTPASTPITVKELGLFLRNPISAAVRKIFGFWEEEEHLLALVENEPFSLPFPYSWDIPVRTIGRAVHRGGSLDDAMAYLSGSYRHAGNCSVAPAGAFGTAYLAIFRQQIQNQLEGGERVAPELSIRSFIERMQPKKMFAAVSFGDGGLGAEPDLQLPAVRICDRDRLPAREIEIQGAIQRVWGRSEAELSDALVITDLNDHPKTPGKHLIEPFLFFTMASAVGCVKAEGSFAIHIAHRKGIHSFHYPVWQPHEAEAYLCRLATDFLGEGCYDLLPFDPIAAKKPLREYLLTSSDTTTAEREDFRNLLQTAAEEDLPEILRLTSAVVPADALPKAMVRLQPLFAGDPGGIS